jgi:lipoprotein signal peptidase
MDNGVAFKSKFLQGWALLGITTGALITIANAPSVGFLSAIATGIPMGLILSFSYGGLGMLFDAGVRHKWRFNDMRKPDFVWYIYPIVGLADIIITISLGFLWGMVKGAFK